MLAYSTFKYNSGQTHTNVQNQITTELAYKTDIAQINWLSIFASAPLCNINVFGLLFQGMGKYMEHSIIAKLSKLSSKPKDDRG